MSFGFLHLGGLDRTNGGWSSLIGIITAICGNILISFALNTQRYAHIRLARQREEEEEEEEEERKNNRSHVGHGTEQMRIADDRARKNLNAGRQHDDDDDMEASETSPLIPSSASSSSESTVRPSKKPSSPAAHKSYLQSPYWWLGISLMTVGEAGNFLAYGFAPASIVSPLGVVALVSNCLIAPLMLNERFRKRDAFGVIVAVAGCITVVFSASDSNPKLGPDEIWTLVSAWEFKTYFGITVFLIVVLMASSKKYGEKSILIDLGLVGLLGGYTALSTKGVASLLSNTIWHVFTFPITYLLVIVLVSTAILQIKYINRALQRFDSTQVIPIQFVIFTLSVIIGSAVLYRDFERTTTDDALKFFAGCALTFSGVWLITSGRSRGRGSDEEEGIETEDTINLVDEEHQQPEIRDGGHDGNARRASLRPPSARRLQSSHSDAPSLIITSDNTQPRTFSFEDASPLTDNPWTFPPPANISAIHPVSPSTLHLDPISRDPPPPMHATTSAPLIPTAATLRLAPHRPQTPNRTISSPVPQESPSPSHHRHRHLDPSDTTPGRLHSILPGPLTNPLSASLSAIVADNLRRGVEFSPGSTTRRRTFGRGSRAEALEAIGQEYQARNRDRSLSATLGDLFRVRSRSDTLQERDEEEEEAVV